MGTMCSAETKTESGMGGAEAFDEQRQSRASASSPTLMKTGPHCPLPGKMKGKKATLKTTLRVGDCQIILCLGDICQEETDSLVHPIDDFLDCSLEFSEYILSAAGPDVKSEIEKYKLANQFRLSIGHIFLTSPGGLSVKHLVHLIVPKFVTGEMGEEKLLEQAVYSLLRFADQKNLTTMSCPVLGVTNGRFPVKVSLHAFFGAVNRYFLRHKDDTTIKQIRIISSDEQTAHELIQEGWDIKTNEDFSDHPEVGTLSTAFKDFEKEDPLEDVEIIEVKQSPKDNEDEEFKLMEGNFHISDSFATSNSFMAS